MSDAAGSAIVVAIGAGV
jgi:hypothetical protein